LTNNLQKARKAKNLTLVQLGQMVNLQDSTISQYEQGKREPKIKTWKKLAECLDTTVPYLQGIDNKPKPGYSKEYIFQQLLNAYKQNWLKDYNEELIGISDYYRVHPLWINVLSARQEINNYLVAAKIKKPKEITPDFFAENFSFVFNNVAIGHLLTTKDIYSDDEIKELLLNEIVMQTLQLKDPALAKVIKKRNDKAQSN
jgi:transcriptional regulator with XRE-family HTH domain